MDKSRITWLIAVLASAASAASAAPLGVVAAWSDPLVRVDFVFDNAVRQTNDLPTAALRAARRQMISGEPISSADLQALADQGDGLAAFRYAKLVQEMETPDLTGSAAHYFAIAAYTGRAFAVAPLARLLKEEGMGYSESRLTHGLNAMTVQALSGNADAAILLGEMYAEGVPFGRDLGQAQHFLGMADGGGSLQAVLNLGLALMTDPTDVAAGHVGALSALGVAAAGDDLAVRVTAENLLRLIETAPFSQPAPQSEVTQ